MDWSRACGLRSAKDAHDERLLRFVALSERVAGEQLRPNVSSVAGSATWAGVRCGGLRLWRCTLVDGVGGAHCGAKHIGALSGRVLQVFVIKSVYQDRGQPGRRGGQWR